MSLNYYFQASVCHGKDPEAEGPQAEGEQVCHRTTMMRDPLLGGGPCDMPSCEGILNFPTSFVFLTISVILTDFDDCVSILFSLLKGLRLTSLMSLFYIIFLH